MTPTPPPVEFDQETVERVARAIVAADNGLGYFAGEEVDEEIRESREHYRSCARAALTAANVVPRSTLEAAEAARDALALALDAERLRVAELEVEVRRLREDVEAMNWLERQIVEVRTPRRWGSRPNFTTGPEETAEPSDLRERVKAARTAEGKG
jgi:hypothetical protein